MQEDKRLYTLEHETPAKAVLKMGVPLTLGMFIMVLYNLVDTYFIGQLNNDYMLAAVNLSYPIMMIMIALSNMVGIGASSMMARAMGADDNTTAKKTLTVGFELTVLLSVIVAVVGLILINPIVKGLGADETTFEYTKQYAGVILAGSICTMGSYTFGQFLRSEGSVKYSVVGMVAGTVVNIVLDPVFIFVLKMDVMGAAIATVAGNAVGALVAVIYYLSGKTLLRPSLKLWRPTAQILGEIFWVGVPATLETLLTASAAIVCNNLAAAYDALYVAAMGISSKLLSFGSYIYQGFAAGIQPLMGYNYGAKNFDRMLKILKAGVIIITAIELCVMGLFGLLAPVLVGVFSENQTVITIGARVLRTTMFILPFVGSISMSRSTFQAMGKPQYAFAITVMRQFVLYVPLLLIFDKVFGFFGMIWAQPCAELVMMFVSLTLLAYKLKSFKKREASNEKI